MLKEDKNRFMQMAIDLSQYALDSGCGGPFGAIIVKDGKIIGSGSNRVTADLDPTAHGEVVAIKEACKNLKSIDLSGCELYTSAEPCPMCTAAIYWSKIAAVYYCNTEEEALAHGFSDKKILAEVRKPIDKRQLPFKRIKNPLGVQIFKRSLEG